MRHFALMFKSLFTTPRVVLPLLALVVACNPMGDFLGPDGGCWFPCSTGSSPVAFAVSPDSASILLGDTITLSAWQCPNGGCFIGVPVVSRWTVAGDAVTASTTRVPPTTLTPTSSVLLRAVAPGLSSATAVASEDTSKHRTVSIAVADSSAITVVALHTCCNPGDTVLMSGDVLSSLKDHTGRRYRAQPTEWFVSDTTLITLGTNSKFGSGSRTIQVKKAGVVEIRARFRTLESRLQVVVRP